jgi:hypothetical protein
MCVVWLDINAVNVGRSGPVVVSGALGALCSTNPG